MLYTVHAPPPLCTNLALPIHKRSSGHKSISRPDWTKEWYKGEWRYPTLFHSLYIQKNNSGPQSHRLSKSIHSNYNYHHLLHYSENKELNELMKDDGGFEGNAQTLRILCKLFDR
jgi:hypothetical protein